MSGLWTSDDLRAATGGRTSAEFAATGVAIDTRGLVPGDLFIALHGERRDGHDFVAEALARGAAGAMVDRVPDGFPTDAPLLLVPDTLAALAALGAYARARTRARVIAVTGSVGKTTTKEMLRIMLAAQARVHAAEASFNNQIGVPLTLARLPLDAEAAVIEIGMNHPGEIAPLARLARPHVAVITAIAPAHIGQMGSLEAIADEKAAILSGVVPNGAAVLPGDSPLLPRLAAGLPMGLRVLRFGTAKEAEARLVSCIEDPAGSQVVATIGGLEFSFRLAAPGRHMAMNALAALAAVAAAGFDPAAAAASLAGFAALAGRGAARRIALPGGEMLLFDESYNASPASVRAALAVLGLQPAPRRIAVLGDMRELGAFGEAAHAGLAEDVLAAADLVFTCGELMRHLYDALPAGRRGAHAPDAAALAPLVAAAIAPGDAVLVKGSYASAMRTVVTALGREAG